MVCHAMVSCMTLKTSRYSFAEISSRFSWDVPSCSNIIARFRYRPRISFGSLIVTRIHRVLNLPTIVALAVAAYTAPVFFSSSCLFLRCALPAKKIKAKA